MTTQEKKAGEKEAGKSGINEYVASLFDQTLQWGDVEWLKSVTRLPIILKGIMRPDDALKAADMGVEGVFVSNHGARQLDTVPATVDALPAVVAAVGHRVEVYLDGGVTLGTDALKAIALGAKMVFVGRPVLWGLAYDGQKGVEKVLEILKVELDMAMALAGVDAISEIQHDFVVIPKSAL